ncbi:MAG TPA: ABC transporter permease [Mycobacteriales bacterium]|jgi:peptide/nickel transport system permease protein|nr:ABC transporter permease [Mycobacteriales bacterium]
MAWYIVRRVLGIILVLLITSAVTYAIFYLIPSDPARLSCGKPCTPDTLRTVRANMGLDRSIVVQWLEFLRGVVVGRTYGSGATAIHCSAPCLGYSFFQDHSVSSLIADRFPVTFSIAIGAAVLWLIFGITSGTISAIKRGTAIDRAAMVAALAGVSAPAYLVGLIGIYVFGFELNIVPVNGYANFVDGPVQWAWHLVLPWCTLAFLSAALYARLTRGQMLDVLGEDYITTARAKGLPERTVVIRHGMRAALTPIVTIFGLDLGSLLGGAVISEQVFSMQGIGRLVIDAVHQYDLPVIVGTTLFAAFLIICANLVVDVVYAFLDPRVTLE